MISYKIIIKRFLDLIIAVMAFILLLPFFLLVTILLLIVNEGRVFFVQLRPGKHGLPFKIIKFKTMNDKRSAIGALLPDADRLTAVGKLIRKTSLDEIPQLLNVIKGDMSLIGPRPLLMEYISLYCEKQSRRHEVKPGITGWAQVNGRNAITWEQKFEYDVWYVDNISFKLDMRILYMTVIKVFKSEGVNANGHASMEIFKGSAK
jgi:undecaprenyl phosphate N,N'-diacetylbacillosamine 1-phosphate transferase